MLKLEIGTEKYVEADEEFVFDLDYVLELEHSLAALSKWEAKWEKPFLSPDTKSHQEILSYIECMIVDPDYPREVWDRLTTENFKKVDAYINSKQTATWFNENAPGRKTPSEMITAELVYYWLSTIPNIPFDAETCHLNKLFTFIKIHDVKNGKPQKMNQRDAAAQRRELNRKRLEENKTNG